MDYYDDYYWKSESQLKAEEKNRRLVGDLMERRKNFCGIGTNLVKRMLNRLSETDDVAKALRIALETEDYNIQAKDSYGKYKRKIYDQKEKSIKELSDISKKNIWLHGMRNESSFSTSYIVYFDIPGCEQVSWHTNATSVNGMPKYRIAWDGKENSTLDKFEMCISSLYRSEIEASAKRNKIVLGNLLDRLEKRYQSEYGEYKRKRSTSLLKCKEIEEDEIVMEEVCPVSFVNTLNKFKELYTDHTYEVKLGNYVVDGDNIVSVDYVLHVDGMNRGRIEKSKKGGYGFWKNIEKSFEDSKFSLESVSDLCKEIANEPCVFEDRGETILVKFTTIPSLSKSYRKEDLAGTFGFITKCREDMSTLKSKYFSNKKKKEREELKRKKKEAKINKESNSIVKHPNIPV